MVDLAIIPDGERFSTNAKAMLVMLKVTHEEVKRCIE